VALPPLRLAVMVACPSALDATGKSAKSAPAGMFTLGGTEAMLVALDESATAVAAFGAVDTVTRSTPGVPLGSVSVAGVIAVTTGGGGVTSTRLVALVPLTLAVTSAKPTSSALTGSVALTAPAGTVTLAGTWTTAGAVFAIAIAVSVS